ncbi:MAG: hypothetical protein LBI03_00550 [Clostridiales bacterium]|jgi:hypothetical protein|nr:hypothetical protein [Clostridiales bacterium]
MTSKQSDNILKETLSTPTVGMIKDTIVTATAYTSTAGSASLNRSSGGSQIFINRNVYGFNATYVWGVSSLSETITLKVDISDLCGYAAYRVVPMVNGSPANSGTTYIQYTSTVSGSTISCNINGGGSFGSTWSVPSGAYVDFLIFAYTSTSGNATTYSGSAIDYSSYQYTGTAYKPTAGTAGLNRVSGGSQIAVNRNVSGFNATYVWGISSLSEAITIKVDISDLCGYAAYRVVPMVNGSPANSGTTYIQYTSTVSSSTISCNINGGGSFGSTWSVPSGAYVDFLIFAYANTSGNATTYSGSAIDYSSYQYTAANSPSTTVNGWLRLYSSITMPEYSRRIVNIPTGTNLNTWYSFETGQTNPALNRYVYTEYAGWGGTPVVNYGSKGEKIDQNGRYWVAVGPMVINPNHDPSKAVTAEEMNYGTCIDVVLKNSSGQVYYFPACVGDCKNHTWSNGIVQTGYAFPNGTDPHPENADGSIVEFITTSILSEGLNQYQIVQLIVYDHIS